MWGLGCVYLEFVTWYLGGWKSVERFLDIRDALDYTYGDYNIFTATFFDVFKGKNGDLRARVKPASMR